MGKDCKITLTVKTGIRFLCYYSLSFSSRISTNAANPFLLARVLHLANFTLLLSVVLLLICKSLFLKIVDRKIY